MPFLSLIIIIYTIGFFSITFSSDIFSKIKGRAWPALYYIHWVVEGENYIVLETMHVIINNIMARKSQLMDTVKTAINGAI